MRQPGLGKLDWIKEDKNKRKKESEKLAKLAQKDEGKTTKTKGGKRNKNAKI